MFSKMPMNRKSSSLSVGFQLCSREWGFRFPRAIFSSAYRFISLTIKSTMSLVKNNWKYSIAAAPSLKSSRFIGPLGLGGVNRRYCGPGSTFFTFDHCRSSFRMEDVDVRVQRRRVAITGARRGGERPSDSLSDEEVEELSVSLGSSIKSSSEDSEKLRVANKILLASSAVNRLGGRLADAISQ